MNLLCDSYTACNSDGTTFDGIAPFTTAGDLSTPNPKYFDRAAKMVQLAANHGMVLLLDPAETGGWLGVLQANGVTKARAYGRFLGQRFRGFKNIVWMSGNDFQSYSNPGDDAVVSAVAKGIHDTDPEALQTVELSYLVSASLDDPTWQPIVGLDAVYTYRPTYAKELQEYRRGQFNFPMDREAAAYNVLWNAAKRLAAGFSDSEQDALFRQTAERIYRLEV